MIDIRIDFFIKLTAPEEILWPITQNRNPIQVFFRGLIQAARHDSKYVIPPFGQFAPDGTRCFAKPAVLTVREDFDADEADAFRSVFHLTKRSGQRAKGSEK
jgi:hypothetical protein